MSESNGPPGIARISAKINTETSINETTNEPIRFTMYHNMQCSLYYLLRPDTAHTMSRSYLVEFRLRSAGGRFVGCRTKSAAESLPCGRPVVFLS